ncbi:hypothetical protein BGX28_000396 [Mortierella sp. GBA30]|nr:hypothetical protein BGX28_000396 [Mortierella sp. GBA30]
MDSCIFFQQRSLRLADQFQCHVLKHSTEIVQRLKMYNPLPLLHLEGEDKETYEGFVKALEDKDRHLQAREAFKQFVMEHVQNPLVHKDMLDSRESSDKYALTGGICTNGHELQVPAYGLSKEKPPSTPMLNTTRAKLADARELFASEDLAEELIARRTLCDCRHRSRHL